MFIAGGPWLFLQQAVLLSQVSPAAPRLPHDQDKHALQGQHGQKLQNYRQTPGQQAFGSWGRGG